MTLMQREVRDELRQEVEEESGSVVTTDPSAAPAPLTRAPVGDIPDPTRHTIELTRIGTLIDRALRGDLPREREPKYWEPRILTPAHINMVLDRAGGFSLVEIAERWDYSAVQVANVLGHPDAQTILSTILSLQAEQLTSIDSRLKAMAPEALNVKAAILRDPAAPPSVRDRVASDILDRAGYAPKQKIETEHSHKFLMPAQVATGLKEALEISRRVAVVDYTRHLQKPDAEVAASHLQVTEVGHLEPADGASPVPAEGLLAAEHVHARVA